MLVGAPGVARKATLCGRAPNDHVTVPPRAIVTVDGEKTFAVAEPCTVAAWGATGGGAGGASLKHAARESAMGARSSLRWGRIPGSTGDGRGRDGESRPGVRHPLMTARR